ncbi:hypothetical protein FHX08_000364 [Rhizobium sp. BK529]|uniref:hypothetical protein n=1 Tax=unclassified Rhizobium TaxID=2613769 RepID=UPI0014044000|nr:MULTISPECIES: hypothetical protein [unclassified Rhizobium]MBB3590020.1 hypothetical protein [Rhizobium sp. BK529]
MRQEGPPSSEILSHVFPVVDRAERKRKSGEFVAIAQRLLTSLKLDDLIQDKSALYIDNKSHVFYAAKRRRPLGPFYVPSQPLVHLMPTSQPGYSSLKGWFHGSWTLAFRAFGLHSSRNYFSAFTCLRAERHTRRDHDG